MGTRRIQDNISYLLIRAMKAHRDRADARVSRVHLTERGRALRGPVQACWAALDERTFAGFTPEERLLARRFFIQMAENLTGE